LADPEKLILAARKHFETGFPNERRVGCPAADVIRAAGEVQLPGEELRAHLFRCSKCFNEYSAAAPQFGIIIGITRSPGEMRIGE
jgi:hypothetical protein